MDVTSGPRPSSFVHFEDMTWPHPNDPREVEWRLRYLPSLGGQPDRSDLAVAASYMAAYRELVRLPVRERNKRVAAIRQAVKAAGGSDGNS